MSDKKRKISLQTGWDYQPTMTEEEAQELATSQKKKIALPLRLASSETTDESGGAPTGRQRRSLVRRAAGAVFGPSPIGAAAVGLDESGNPVVVESQRKVPRILKYLPWTAPYIGRVAAEEEERISLPLKAKMLEQKMAQEEAQTQAEQVNTQLRKLPSYVKLAELGIVRIDPWKGTVEPVLKATDMQNIEAVSAALSGALQQIRDPAIRGQLTGGFGAALAAGNVDAALTMLNSGIARDAMANRPDQSVTEFETYRDAYLGIHGDSPSNRLDAVEAFHTLQTRPPKPRLLTTRQQVQDEVTSLASRYLAEGQGNIKESLARLQTDIISVQRNLRAGAYKTAKQKRDADFLVSHYIDLRNKLLGTAPTQNQFLGMQLR
jgi:hypothetical protein